MKTLINALCVVALVATGLSSESLHGKFLPPSGYFATELQAVKAQLADKTLGELKVSELLPLAERLDVAKQKDATVRLAGLSSYLLPGSAQFRLGDAGLGAAQAGLSLAATAGSLYWAYTLLPADLQFGQLDYFAASHATVVNAWKSHSFNDLAPALGAAVLGGVVDLAVRVWSAHTARDEAKAAIDAGKLEFEPRFGGAGGWGMGFGLRM